MKVHRILLNIDCIFDVMLGCVTYCNPDWVEPMFANGYMERLHNTLSYFNPAIDDALIKKTWEERDTHILKLSPRTNLVNLLAGYIKKSNVGDSEHPQALDYKIVINTYPYNFTQIELRVLFTCLKEILQVNTLTRVHMPLTEITPEYLKASFNRFIVYEFHEWLLSQKANFSNCKIPFVVVVAPLIYLPGNEDKRDEREVMKWVPAGLSSIFDLEFIPLNEVSISVPDGAFE